ncbi:hypothetical protein DFH11DRAFT_389161 [Phellopilus nigrolimitatus]|nr:hypothetical protein DFH11DRAFT_389161 [Phellopilus nigrolimitatus]
MALLPPEVLDMIFKLVGIVKTERHTSTRRPETMLVPLLRVCRTWHPVAERRLYRSISIDKDIFAEKCAMLVLSTGERIAQKLLETLENARIAALVHELSLATFNFYDDWNVTRLHIELISACPNLAHIHIRGYNDDLRGELKEVLMEKKTLVSLTISDYSLKSYPSEYLCDTAELFGMMAHWPKLEKLSFTGLTLRGSDCSEQSPAPSGVICPQLREFDSCGTLDKRDMDTLHAVSGRRLETFYAFIEDTEHARVALLRCLAVWAPCLTSVDLDVMYCSKITEPDRSIAAAFPALRSLKHLRLETGCVRPATLLELPALETLEYIILPTDHTKVPQALASGLEVSGTKSGELCRLPMLRKIRLVFLYETRSSERDNRADLKHLSEVCATRNIELDDYVNFPWERI